MHALDIRDFEIERRLDAFARARLTPDPAAVARARARVMREARLQFEAARIAAHVGPAMALAARRSPIRRFATPLLAASLWAGIVVGSVAAAQAGGALYPARVLLESATLPSNGGERTSAELGRLDARLAEALAGAARGDTGAVAAALAAYNQIAEETLAGSSADASLEARVAAALERHRAILTAVSDSLVAKGNTTAATAVETAIQRAIEHNAAVVERLGTKSGGQPAGAGGNPGTNGAGSGTGGASGAANGAGNGAGAGNGPAGGNDNPNGATGGGPSSTPGDDKPSRPPKPTPEPEDGDVHQPDHRPGGNSQ